MPRKIFLILVFLLASICALTAQCMQNVLVLEYKGEKTKTPLANVEVVVSNAGTTVTNKNGRCTLNFRTLKPGDKVNVRRIERPGYEVFNQDALDQWYISRDGSDMVIVMCSQKRMIETRAQYIKAATENMMRTVTKQETEANIQFKSGLITRQELENRINAIRLEYENKYENIDAYIDHLAHTDLSVVDATEKKVLDMVRHGDILGALAAYESADLLKNYKQEVAAMNTLEYDVEKIRTRMNESEETRNRIYESVKRHNSLLLMVGGEENVEKGMNLLRDVSFADTTNYSALYYYAQYAMRSLRDQEAEEALHYCFNAPDTINRIKAHLIKCEIMNKRKEWKYTAPELELIYNYLKGQSELRDAPDLYLEERAYALYLLVPALSNTLDMEKANKYELELVEQQRYLYEMKLDNETKRDLVNALLAAYNNAVRRIETRELDAFRYLEEAITLQKELQSDDPSRQTAMLAHLHNTMANFCRMTKPSGKDFPRAVQEFEKALVYYEEAYEKNPKAYVHFVTRIYANFAAFYIFSYARQTDKVLPLLKKAEYYNEQETRILGKENIEDAGIVEWFYGYYFADIDRYDEAIMHLKKAEPYFVELSERNPAAFRNNLLAIRKKIEELNQKIGGIGVTP